MKESADDDIVEKKPINHSMKSSFRSGSPTNSQVESMVDRNDSIGQQNNAGERLMEKDLDALANQHLKNGQISKIEEHPESENNVTNSEVSGSRQNLFSMRSDPVGVSVDRLPNANDYRFDVSGTNSPNSGATANRSNTDQPNDRGSNAFLD